MISVLFHSLTELRSSCSFFISEQTERTHILAHKTVHNFIDLLVRLPLNTQERVISSELCDFFFSIFTYGVHTYHIAYTTQLFYNRVVKS